MEFGIVRKLKSRIRQADMVNEFLSCLAGGFGKAIGMGLAIALALWLITVFEISIPKIS